MKTLGHRVSEHQLKEIMKLIDENGIYFIFHYISEAFLLINDT